MRVSQMLPWVDSLGDYQKLSNDETETQRVQESRFAVAFENLIRLGVVLRERDTKLTSEDTWDKPSSLIQKDYYLLSRLGLEFVTACRKPVAK